MLDIQIEGSRNEALLRTSAQPGRAIVVSDLEGTLSAGQAWQGMRDYLLLHNMEKRYQQFRNRQWFGIFRYKLRIMRDVPAFKESWVRGMIQLFAGATQDEMAQLGQFVADHELWPCRRQTVVNELQQHLEQGTRVIVVTGMFEPFLAAFLRHMPGAEGMGTPLQYVETRFTGRIADVFNVGEQKVKRLEPLLTENALLLAGYGDTVRDIPMLARTKEPVAVDPDRALRQTATVRGWRILKAID